VTKVVTFGAFVEILDGVEGLVHISELAQHHVENPREIIQPGDPVRVKILEIDSERRRLSLSIKRVEGQVLPVRPIIAPTEDEQFDDVPDLGLSEEVFAPVAEEAVAEETVAEEALGEAVDEAIAEEIVADAVEDAAADETIAEAVAEEIVEEAVAEEIVEEAVAEEIVEEALAEEIVEEAAEEAAAEETVAEETDEASEPEA